jgi:succinate dehydrogenase / fumarate reductase cytochrome b subunit
MNVQSRPLLSSIGSKVIVAITGLLLVGFVLSHMAGNLLIFLGRDWLNEYAHHLKSLGPFLWVLRIGLLAVFVVHIAMSLQLNYTNSNARPQGYVYEETMQASWASRHMVWTGLVLLAFIAYHLAHFTLGVVDQAKTQFNDKGDEVPLKGPKPYLDLADLLVEEKVQSDGRSDQTILKAHWVPGTNKDLTVEKNHGPELRHDVYSMVLNGFRNPTISVLYLLAMAVLGLHLWHGASSMLQTLGLNSRTAGWFVNGVGPAIALIVVVGNCAIVLSVWLRIIGK